MQAAPRIAAGILAAVVLAPAADLYRDRVQGILARNCLGCHSAGARQGGLDLSTREGLLRGSDHGPVVVPGNPEASQLYKLAAHIAQPAMPLKGRKLADSDISALGDWIRAGAPFEEATIVEGVDLAKAGEHWAFRKPVRPAVTSPGNPVDHFIQQARERRGLARAPEADPRTLLRRLYVDLTGVPPTTAEMAAYLGNRSPRAYEQKVEELLASPRYGERWGRHWLDVWRYSDWYGRRQSKEVRFSQPHVWRWRDWTIESLNANKPYNRMIVEMLAGDEVAPGDPSTVRATGYLVRSWYKFNRNVWLNDTVEYTAASFLGLTLKCARCHTHKYDPIPHSDYYRFRAFFEPHDIRIDRVEGQADTFKDGVARVYDADGAKPTYRFFRGNENTPDTSVALQPAPPSLFGRGALAITPVKLPLAAYFPDSRPFTAAALIVQARDEIANIEREMVKLRDAEKAAATDAAKLKKARIDLAAAEKRLGAAQASIPAIEKRARADAATLMTPPDPNAEQLAEAARAAERKANVLRAEASLMLGQFDFDQAQGDEKKLAAATRRLEAAVAALNEPKEGYTPLGQKYPPSSTGRRLALAQWIASQDNPLTARVAVNHMWMRHFGRPLVSTVFNFGRSGKPASHPELLDWLAVEFMESGWDMKALHRRMVTSQTYRMTSAGQPHPSDPDNVYYTRMNSRRMEAEAVRDSLLAVAGKLDPTMGGPEIDREKGHEVHRRSIYFLHAPEYQMDMLEAFDAASPVECFQRNESIVPQQALALANGRLGLALARTLAAELPASGFIAAAFERVLGRPPSAAEQTASEEFLRDQTTLHRDPAGLEVYKTGQEPAVKPATDPSARARENLVHVLFNHNEFVTVR